MGIADMAYDIQKKQLELYRQAINEIDDYFEYQGSDYIDGVAPRTYDDAKNKVYEIIDRLTSSLVAEGQKPAFKPETGS